MQENLAGMRLIKAFLRRDHEEDRFTKANKDLANMTRKTFRFIEASMPILLFVMNLSLIFIIWFGNAQAIAGETSRSEEHTSELQSRGHLVCRLLLENTKTQI